MIDLATSDADIAATFEVMRQLRPDLAAEEYVARIRGLMASDGYVLAALSEDGGVRAVAGYRFMDMLYCGKLMSVDDLVSDETQRSKGHGAEMLAWLKDRARREGCKELQLVSRVIREQAHSFYFRHGLAIDCFHFRIAL
jgi:GNAT superfamily N-acetyltransferase